MKKIIFLFLVLYSSLFSNTWSGCKEPPFEFYNYGTLSDTTHLSKVVWHHESGDWNYYMIDSIKMTDDGKIADCVTRGTDSYAWVQPNYHCPAGMSENSDGICVCTPPLIPFTPMTCPPTNTAFNETCVEPCPDGTTMQLNGSCCQDGLVGECVSDQDGSFHSMKIGENRGMTWTWGACQCEAGLSIQDGSCKADENATCPPHQEKNKFGICVDKCAMGQERDNFGACVEACPAGQYRDNTNECAPIPEDKCSTRWAGSSLKKTGLYCEHRTIIDAGNNGIPYDCYRNCQDTPLDDPEPETDCTECATRYEAKKSECSRLGAFVDGFFCQENESCEITSYLEGGCTDDDTNPNDPNHGDGSQNNNDNTDDIPDSEQEETNSTSTTQNSDGSTSTTSTSTKSRNYDKAYEKIGDNIEDGTKATNAQTKANKDNTEFLGKKIDTTNDHLKNITDQLKFDENKKNGDFSIDESKYNIDTDSFIDYVTNALTPMVDYTTEKVDAVWNGIKDKYKDKVFFSENCPLFQEVSATISKQNKKIVIWSQERVNQYNIVSTIKPIVIFGFTLAGLMAVFREM